MGKDIRRELRVSKFVQEEIEKIERENVKKLLLKLIRIEFEYYKNKYNEYSKVFSEYAKKNLDNIELK